MGSREAGVSAHLLWFYVFTWLLLLATGIAMYVRLYTRPDSNWPLLYYLAIIAYSYQYEGVLDPRLIYVGLVFALVLRFEYMAGYLWAGLRTIDCACLVYVVWRAQGVLRGWW